MKMNGKNLLGNVFVTANGNVRKNSLEDFSVTLMLSGKIAMKLSDENDKIVGVKICKEDQDVLCKQLRMGNV